MDENEPVLLSTQHADKRLRTIFLLQEDVHQTEQARFAQVIIVPALSIALNAHKSNGVTSGQLAELENLGRMARVMACK